jgi:deoxyadenosine/deoxycytidine kinase
MICCLLITLTNQMALSTSQKDHHNHNRHVENIFSTMIKWSFLIAIQMGFLETRFSNQIDPKF